MSKVERWPLVVAALGLLISGTWFYAQLLVWRTEGHDYFLLVGSLLVTGLIWTALGFAVWRNFKDARRAESLRSQIITIKDEHQTHCEQQQRWAEAEIGRLRHAFAEVDKDRDKAWAQAREFEAKVRETDTLVEARNVEAKKLLNRAVEAENRADQALNYCVEEREQLRRELYTLKTKQLIGEASAPETAFQYQRVTDGGSYPFDVPMNLCQLQALEIRNAELAIPVTLRNVRASITYIHDNHRDRIGPVLASWKCINQPESSNPGTHLTTTLNLDSNESQLLIVVIQRADATVWVLPERGQQFQQVTEGHWDLTMTLTADNSLPLMLTGGLTVIRQVEENRHRLQFDVPAFAVCSLVAH